MTLIQCHAIECRHNGQGRCMLDEILVASASAATTPAMLEETSRLMDGPWLPGYSSEFADYAGYAQTHPENFANGALCQSYTP